MVVYWVLLPRTGPVPAAPSLRLCCPWRPTRQCERMWPWQERCPWPERSCLWEASRRKPSLWVTSLLITLLVTRELSGIIGQLDSFFLLLLLFMRKRTKCSSSRPLLYILYYYKNVTCEVRHLINNGFITYWRHLCHFIANSCRKHRGYW